MQRKLLIATMLAILVATALVVGAAAIGAPSGTASTPVNVTNDVYANNEESLGMSPNGEWLAGAWNDWEYNDGCGFSYSTDGGDTWAPETFAPFTAFSNTPGVDPIMPTKFAIAGDPSVVFNPRSNKFDVICQAFGTKSGNEIQMLSTTFDPTEADPTADVNLSYGAGRLDAAGRDHDGQVGRKPERIQRAVPRSRGRDGRHRHRRGPPLRPAVRRLGRIQRVGPLADRRRLFRR